ncbi:MAG: SGNH/GDSL hydrolase family protein [Bacteroidota bacterium]
MLLNNKKHRIELVIRTSIFFLVFIGFIACSTPNSIVTDVALDQEEIPVPDSPDSSEKNPETQISINYLALGDSYTIGTGVCNTCSYPIQLKDSLLMNEDPAYDASVDIIAQSGWTTTRLLQEIDNSNLNKHYNLVTLLIGVNNQYQNKPFDIYQNEFVTLLNKAIEFAQNRSERVIVISIPDYAFSIFGQGLDNPENISTEINDYNAFAKSICESRNITFVNVTNISREASDRMELLASDGLHLSELAYSEFVTRFLPIVREKIEDN